MKRLLVFLLLFSPLLTAAQESSAQRLVTNIKNAEMPFVSYVNVERFSSADQGTRTSEGMTLPNGEIAFDMADDDAVYIVLVSFKRKDSNTQLLVHLIMLPGERLTMTGEMYEHYIDYDIEGSVAFGDYARHRRQTWGTYEEQLQKLNFDPCRAVPMEEVELISQYKDLNEKQHAIFLDYIKANPDSQLSAIYFSRSPLNAENVDDVYAILGEEVKNGPYKRFVDVWRELYKNPVYCTGD